MTGKDCPFVWIEECEKNFMELKTWQAQAPVLVILNPTLGFKVYCDAFLKGLGFE